MGLSFAEQETVVTFNRGEDRMNVYTADKYLLARLKKLKAYTLVREHRQGGKLIAADFEADKRLLTFRSKIPTGTLAPEQVEEARKRIMEYNMAK